MVTGSQAKDANETDIKTLKEVDLGEVDLDNKSLETQIKRESGYSYNKPNRFSRPRFHSGYRERLSNRPNQLNRPFNQYGLPSSSLHHNNPNQHRPHHQYRQPNKATGSFQNQGVPSPIRNVDFVEPSPIASQNNEAFRISTANYLPPKNQKLPVYSSPNVFSTSQQEAAQGNLNQQINSDKNQNFVQGDFQDQRISDAALFLTQNAETLSQLYGAPAPNQEYAPNNEYLNQITSSQNHQHNSENDLNSQTENIQSSQASQGFSGSLPSYASGILNSQETLENIQSLEKDRLISQLRQALTNQAQFQTSESLGRNPATQENVHPQTGSGSANPGGHQLVSPSVFGGEQSAFGQIPFLSGSAISPPGYGLTYGLSTTAQAPVTTTTTSHLQGAAGGISSQSGSAIPSQGPLTPSITSGFPQYGTYIPTFIPGTNFVANVPAYGSGFLGTNSVTTPNHPSSPTQFGIPIPTFSGQKPISVTPTFIPSPASPSQPGVQISGPTHPGSVTGKPVHPAGSSDHPVSIHSVSSPVHPIPTPPHSVSTPVHPVTSPIIPAGTIRPVSVPDYPVVTSVHPTYGVQASFVNSFLLKPIKTVFPVYHYPTVPLQHQKPGSVTQPWNYAPTFPQTKSSPIWK